MYHEGGREGESEHYSVLGGLFSGLDSSLTTYSVQSEHKQKFIFCHGESNC